MQLTIDINERAIDKVMYLLNHLKDDVKIIDNNLDIEVIDENDRDYKYILQGREERKKNPQNYMSEDEINWD